MQTAKLFINGLSQAVRLPKEFRFPGSYVFINKIGNIVNLIPKRVCMIQIFKKDFEDKAMPGYVVHPGNTTQPLGDGVKALPFGAL